MDKARGRWRRIAPWLAAGLFYSTFAIVQTWPLVTQLSDVLPNDLIDPVLNTWILWWNSHTVPFTAQWWNAPIFYPASGALTFSEVLLGLAPLTSPLQWLGVSPVAAYNITFVLTFPLSALAAHALAYRLIGRHDAATIAGLIYGFAPYRIAHFPHIQVMVSYWMPVALISLHEYSRTRRARWLAVFGVAWLIQALSNGYYLLFFPVLLGLWILWFAVSRSSLRLAAAIAATWLVASLPLVPLLWTYRTVHAGFGFQRHLVEVSSFGADVMSLLDASPYLKFWSLRRFHQPEGELFPGFTATVLVVLLLVSWLRASQRPFHFERRTMALFAGSVALAAVGFSVFLFGPWTITIGSTTLVSVRDASRALSIAAVLFVLAVATLPRVVAAYRARSPLTFYLLAMVLLYVLCFGPRPKFLGLPFLYRGPYSLLLMLPGYDALRVPARFAMLAALCLSVVAAFAFVRLTARLGHTRRLIFAAVVMCGVLVDSAIGEMPLRRVPERMSKFESLPAGVAVLELPLGDLDNDSAAMYRSMYHGRPLVNGYSGFFPHSYAVLQRGFRLRDPGMFDAVSAYGPVVVVVNPVADDADDRWSRQLAAHPGTVLLGEESGRKVFLVPAGTRPPDFVESTRLPIRASANVNNDRMPLALDGDPMTRWDSGPQRGIEEVTIDLLGVRFIDGITMTINDHLSDFPRSLVIETSDDGQEWTRRWEGGTAAIAFAASLRNRLDLPLAFAFPHLPARFLRLRQLGNDPIYYWSIFELAVYGD